MKILGFTVKRGLFVFVVLTVCLVGIASWRILGDDGDRASNTYPKTSNDQSITIEPIIPFEVGSGRLIMGNQVDEYTYTPILDGNYILMMSKNPNFATLALRVYDEDGILIDSTWGTRVNLTLLGGHTYTIRVSNYNFPRPNPIGGGGWAYELTILEQKPIVDVSGYNVISDRLQFSIQENNYTFTPLVSGNHQFRISSEPSHATLRLAVLDEDETSIGSTWFSGINVDLVAGQTYTIRVNDHNFPSWGGLISGDGWAYTITIEEPLKVGILHDPNRHSPYWYHSPNISFQFVGDIQNELDALDGMRQGMESWNELNTRVYFNEDNDSHNRVIVMDVDDSAVSRTWLGAWGYALRDGPYVTQFHIGMFVNRIDDWLSRNRNSNPDLCRNATFQTIFAHELGHAIGLNHPPYASHMRDSIMFGRMSLDLDGIGIFGPTAFDVDSINMLWPPSGPVLASVDARDTTMNIMHVSAIYPTYDDIYQLADRSTTIVHVEVLDERIERLNTWLGASPSDIDPYQIFTVYRLRVIESFYGNTAPGDILEVRQLGGQQDNEWLVNTSQAPISVGSQAIMFLHESYIEGYPHLLLNPYQTIYHQASNDSWEGTHEKNDFIFTITELEEAIAAASPTIIPGDVDGNDTVTAADVALLRAYLAGHPVTICQVAANVTGDGQITAADVALLRAYLAGHPVELLTAPQQ